MKCPERLSRRREEINTKTIQDDVIVTNATTKPKSKPKPKTPYFIDMTNSS